MPKQRLHRLTAVDVAEQKGAKKKSSRRFGRSYLPLPRFIAISAKRRARAARATGSECGFSWTWSLVDISRGPSILTRPHGFSMTDLDLSLQLVLVSFETPDRIARKPSESRQ